MDEVLAFDAMNMLRICQLSLVSAVSCHTASGVTGLLLVLCEIIMYTQFVVGKRLMTCFWKHNRSVLGMGGLVICGLLTLIIGSSLRGLLPLIIGPSL